MNHMSTQLPSLLKLRVEHLPLVHMHEQLDRLLVRHADTNNNITFS